MGQALLVRRGGSGTGNVFAFIVATYPEGSTCTCSNGEKTFTAKGTTIPYVFFIPEAGTWTVTSTNGTDSSTVDVVISSAGQSESVKLAYSLQLADFNITGIEGTDYIKIDDGDGNWRIKVLTSQTVTADSAGKIDVFVVGAGAGGNNGGASSGNGGDGGETLTETVTVEPGTSYQIVIGAGGAKGGKAGGSTSFDNLTAPGGSGANNVSHEVTEFGDVSSESVYGLAGNAGRYPAQAGADNTGNGGDGGYGNGTAKYDGMPGGSGIVIFRNARG